MVLKLLHLSVKISFFFSFILFMAKFLQIYRGVQIDSAWNSMISKLIESFWPFCFPDEFKTSSGSLSSSPVYFANSWQVVNSVDGVSLIKQHIFHYTCVLDVVY